MAARSSRLIGACSVNRSFSIPSATAVSIVRSGEVRVSAACVQNAPSRFVKPSPASRWLSKDSEVILAAVEEGTVISTEDTPVEIFTYVSRRRNPPKSAESCLR